MISPFPLFADEPSVVIVRIIDGSGNICMSINGPNGRSEIVEVKGSSLGNQYLKDSGKGYYDGQT
jgi:hypothetical protein